jgi:branched-chain amino acid transport system permease protein
MAKHFVIRHFRPIAAILFLVVVALVPLMTRSPYYLDVSIRIIINALLAICFIMVLRTGLVNLSMTAFWGLGAYVSAVLVMKLGVSFWLALPATAVVVGIVALVVGAVIISSGWLGFIVLTAVLGMVFSVTVGSIDYVGAYSGLNSIPPPDPIKLGSLPELVFKAKTPYFYLILIIAIVVILVCLAFYSSSVGRAWRAIRLNARLARALGVDVFKYRLLAFVVSCMMLGLIGSFYAHYVRYISPATFPIMVSVKIQMYAVLGGFGFAILGPLVGSFFMTLLPEVMQSMKEYANLFIGGIVILLMLFLPGGLLSIWSVFTRRARPFSNVVRTAAGIFRRNEDSQR